MISLEFPPKSGGIGSYVYNLSRKLVQKGHQVTVVTKGSSSLPREELIDGINLIRLPYLAVYPLHVWLHGVFVNRELKVLERRFTLVHVHSPGASVVRTRLPVVTTVHTPMKIDSRYYEVVDFYSLADKLQSMLVYPLIERELFRISSRITAVSKSVARELGEYGLDDKEIAVVGNGVDEKTFTPACARKENFAERYVLYTGVLRARKGLFDFVRCAELVSRAYPDVKFVIAGRGPLLRKLEESVKRVRLQKQIIFLGYVDKNKFIQVYQNATVHVVPSYYEGLPTVLLEAMSCGLPVVATDIGGNNEVITPEVNGFLVPPKCPEEMAKAINRLLDDASLRENIGRAARRTIEKYYTWDKIADNILKCYEGVL
jgi:glycosyltransferase involved in cell wall biosynthesis